MYLRINLEVIKNFQAYIRVRREFDEGPFVSCEVLRYQLEGNIWDQPHRDWIINAIARCYNMPLYLDNSEPIAQLAEELEYELDNHSNINLLTLESWNDNIVIRAHRKCFN